MSSPKTPFEILLALELFSSSLRYFVLVDFMVHHHLMCCDNKL